MADAGRWSLTGMPRASAALPGAETGTGGNVEIEGGVELARVLLDRYRDLLQSPMEFPILYLMTEHQNSRNNKGVELEIERVG